MTDEAQASLSKVFDDALDDAPEKPPVVTDDQAAAHEEALPSLDKEDTPPAAKKEEPAPSTTKVVQQEKKPDVVKSDIQRRLAPDFSSVVDATKDATSDAAKEERPEFLKELDTAIDTSKSQKQKVDLGKLRSKLEELHYENLTFKNKPPVAAVVDDGTTKATIERLEKELADRDERLGRLDLVQKPQFQRDFIQPRNKAFNEAQAILKEYGTEPGKLQRAMTMTGKMRAEALDEIRETIGSDHMRGQFDILIRDIDRKTSEIDEQLKNHRERSEEYARQEAIDKQKNIEKTTGDLKTLLASAHRQLAEEVKLEVLQKTGKADFKWWDDQADEISQIAEEIMFKSTPEKAAIAAHLAASAGPYRSLWQAEREARLDAEKRLREYEDSDPGLGTTRTTKTSTSTAADDDDIADAIIKNLRAGVTS